MASVDWASRNVHRQPNEGVGEDSAVTFHHGLQLVLLVTGAAVMADGERTVADLVARTARPSVLGWLITMVVLGAVVGSLVGAVGQMVSDPKVAEMLEALAGGAGSIEDIFLRTELLFASAAVTAAALAVLGRLSA